MQWAATLKQIGNVLGVILLVYGGLYRGIAQRNLPAFLIALSVFMVGPVEDRLKKRLRKGKAPEDEPACQVVDQATSVAFVLLLFIVIALLP
jgi:hypothetical protein